MNSTIEKCADIIRKKTDIVPRVALTLGSGLSSYGDHIKVEAEISYHDLPGFPFSTVQGHIGRFLIGYADDVPVICMQGRVHYYEGYPVDKVVLPARVMHALGAQILFLTNASGGINSNYQVGSLALITDHISSFIPNPLIGPNDDEEGPRFPDMSAVYDPELRKLLKETAVENHIPLQEGVYAQLTGPSFETPAEIRMLKTLGADMVGMSTVVEAITGRHLGMRVVGISLISNLAAGISKVPLSNDDVVKAGLAATPLITKLVTESIKKM